MGKRERDRGGGKNPERQRTVRMLDKTSNKYHLYSCKQIKIFSLSGTQIGYKLQGKGN